jgi:shikimate dehydrogenase
MMKFGLIGYPVVHSFSKKYFTEKFEKEGIDAVYDLYPLERIELFKELIASQTLTGLNVTIPHKQTVIPFLDELDATAAEIGAVNVIKFGRDQGGLKLKGYNTDAIGFENSIKPLLKPHYRKALILGTGGASKAIDYALRKNGIDTTFVSRSGSASQLAYGDLTHEMMKDFPVIVNCTPLGMDPAIEGYPAIPYAAIGSGHLLYDVVYKPEETVFLRKGKEQGATTINGLEMLWGQAEAAWKIWNQ